PDIAILNAANHLNIPLKSRPVLSERNNSGKLMYSIPELTLKPVTAELKYELEDDKLVLVWNLSMDMKANADYWDMNIDATSGAYVSKHNYTVYCNHNGHQYTNHDNCNTRTLVDLNLD